MANERLKQKADAIRQTVQLETECNTLWQQACQFDGLPPNSKGAVVFSSGNHYAAQFGAKAQQLRALRASVFTYRKR